MLQSFHDGPDSVVANGLIPFLLRVSTVGMVPLCGLASAGVWSTCPCQDISRILEPPEVSYTDPTVETPASEVL